MSDQGVVDWPLSDYNGRRSFHRGPSPSRKKWQVQLVDGPRYSTTEVEAEEVRYGNGQLTFVSNGELTDLFNLDFVVSVRTVFD